MEITLHSVTPTCGLMKRGEQIFKNDSYFLYEVYHTTACVLHSFLGKRNSFIELT
jgi:hypothetical protein